MCNDYKSTMPLSQKNSDGSVDDSEEQIESALQDLLDAEAAAVEFEDNSDPGDDSDADAAGEKSGSDAEEPRDDTDTVGGLEDAGYGEDEIANAGTKSRKRHHQPDSSDSTAAGKIGRVDQSLEQPLNFSRVDTSLPPEQIKQSFPLFSE